MGKIYSGIMGLVVGDALGVPFEFMPRDTFIAMDMVGYGTYDQHPGTWSDDSSLTLATVESIVRQKCIDPLDIMRNFSDWLNRGDFTPYGEVFDVGGTTRRAISQYTDKGIDPLKCGGTSVMDNGNGALMRILPLAYVPHTNIDILHVAGLTHNHIISNSACTVYIEIAEALIQGSGKHEIANILSNTRDKLLPEFERLYSVASLARDEIRSNGYVVDTLEAALWCLLTTDSYRECVLAAVNLGEDTDTVAAIAGGLAGIVYGCGGVKGIPDEWIAQIPRKDWIAMLCSKLEQICI